MFGGQEAGNGDASADGCDLDLDLFWRAGCTSLQSGRALQRALALAPAPAPAQARSLCGLSLSALGDGGQTGTLGGCCEWRRYVYRGRTRRPREGETCSGGWLLGSDNASVLNAAKDGAWAEKRSSRVRAVDDDDDGR